MKVTWEVEEAKNIVRVVAEFDTREIASLNLDHLDRALLREPHEEPADILLKAEMIARRLQYRTRMETSSARCTCKDFPGADQFCTAHKAPETCEQCCGHRYLGDIPCSACNAMGESPALNRRTE